MLSGRGRDRRRYAAGEGVMPAKVAISCNRKEEGKETNGTGGQERDGEEDFRKNGADQDFMHISRTFFVVSDSSERIL